MHRRLPARRPAAYKAAYKVSYNRPFHTAEDDSGRSWLFTGAEYPMIRFLERNGYDVSYIERRRRRSRNPALLLNHKVFMSSGHDEYWSAPQRANVEAARDAGVNLAFFSGNEMFWKTRWEPSADGTNTPNRTLVSYKDTHFTEPQDPVEWTGTWRDPRFTTAADERHPGERAHRPVVRRQLRHVADHGARRATRTLRLWRNTAVASLTSGQSLDARRPTRSATSGTSTPTTASARPGEFELSSTTVSGLELFTDYGSTTKLGGTATHNLTMYRAPSGARVFGAGTVQWAWGLDDWNPDGDAARPQHAAGDA